ncbi:hypothetical protein ABGB08_00330 [Acrocarpospora sp. B8E8]
MSDLGKRLGSLVCDFDANRTFLAYRTDNDISLVFRSAVTHRIREKLGNDEFGVIDPAVTCEELPYEDPGDRRHGRDARQFDSPAIRPLSHALTP